MQKHAVNPPPPPPPVVIKGRRDETTKTIIVKSPPPTSPDTPAPSREDEVLIREIDEAVREDALYEFMRKHGVKVLGGVLALIAALGGYMIWDYYAEQALETQSETVISALDLAEKNDFKSASEKVAGLLGDDASPGARAAARFIQAAAALEAGDKTKASGLYKQIAAELGLSVSTIRSHLHNVYRKIDVADRAQAVLKARERGWI